ncbi:hypothetical protein [Bacillus subtilis]|uniref:hypothetical protein n=1 Tax=Bacillus subtilis TaxID=1423 RepID=UPI002E1B0419|nr:hypothetical protein [Bacillus subtilis]MED3488128.1 hypothetical protein [Bacillus subtilis]
MQELLEEASLHFSELLKGLNTGLVVLIDDDFTMSQDDDFEGILSELVCLDEKEVKSLVNKLREANYSRLADNILKFSESFREIPKVKIHFDGLVVNAKRIFMYLNKLEFVRKDQIKEMAESLIDLLQKNYKQQEIQDLFMRYGIGINEIQNYKDILRIIKHKNNVRYYKQKPEIDKINEDMKDCITGSQFCIFIVDKLLGDEDGVRFVEEELLPFSKNKNLISIIYTSQPENKKTPQEIKDYFVIEIYKEDQEALKQLTDGLALCAYVELFNRLSKIHINSIEQARELALSRKDNMIYLARMANEEGVTPYEAVSNWFQLATQYKMARGLMNDETNDEYKFIMGLTHFLQEEFLGSNFDIELDKEATIQELNAFEIFDYTINVQCQPPAPGDVFKMSNGEFGILVGQDCDLIVRGASVKRKAKHADLLRAEFIPTNNLEKLKKDAKHLNLNYFYPEKTESCSYGTLKIHFENQKTSDFVILDICTFNQDGKSQIELDRELDPDLKPILPNYWHKYYGKIQNKFNDYLKMQEICSLNNINLDILKNNDYSILEFEQEDSRLSYPVERICRIKREFRDILLNSYWEYRGRTGINTIALIEKEKIPYLNIELGYPGQIHKSLDDIEIEAFLHKNSKHKNSLDLKKMLVTIKIDNLKQKFEMLREIERDFIEIDKSFYTHPQTGIKFTKEIIDGKLDTIKITLPYKIEHNGKCSQEQKFPIMNLLTEKEKKLAKDSKNSLYYVLEKQKKQVPIYNSRKNKYCQVNVDQLLEGIIIPDLSIKIKLENGRIFSEKLIALEESV